MKKKLICLLVAGALPGIALAGSTSAEIKALQAQVAALQKQMKAMQAQRATQMIADVMHRIERREGVLKDILHLPPVRQQSSVPGSG